ncbi:LEM-3-like GIY-YIG domain-containing protein, partial [Neisseria sp. P0001.S010]
MEVIHVIHRQGMNEKTAFEVEADLIDAYPGLSNEQSGHGNREFVSMHVSEIQDKYDAHVAKL